MSAGLKSQGHSFDPELQTIVENTYRVLGRYSTAKQCPNERIAKYLQERLDKKHLVVLTGVCGSGKTTLATSLMNKYISGYPDFTPVIITKPSQWNRIASADGNFFVLLEDILGKINIDRKELESWEKFFDMIFSCSEKENFRIILSIRTVVMKEAEKTLKKYHLFHNEHLVDLSSSEYEMTRKEKVEMLRHYCKTKGVELLEDRDSVKSNSRVTRMSLSNDDIACIANTNPLLGFPMTCHLFFSYGNFFDCGAEFFKEARDLLYTEIDGFKKTNSAIYCYLAYILFCGGDSYLVDSEIDMEFIADLCTSIHEEPQTLTDIHEAMDVMDGIFIRTLGHGVVGSKNVKCMLTFNHEVILEAVISSIGKSFPESFLRLASTTLIKEFARSEDQISDSDEVVIYIPKKLNKVFAKTIISKFHWVTEHPSYNVESFVPYLLDELEDTHRFSRYKNAKFESLFKRASKGLGRNMCKEIMSRYGLGIKPSTFLIPFSGPILSPAFMESQVRHALENDLVDVVMLLLDLNIFGIKRGSKTIKYPVIYASKHCSERITGYLLQHGGDAKDCDADGRSVIHYATRNGWTDILDEIIKNHSNLIDKPDKHNMTPAIFSASLTSQQHCSLCQQKDINASLQGCEYILHKGATIHAVDTDGRKLLHYAVRNGWTSLADKILAVDIDMINHLDDHGMTPLLFAASLTRRIHSKTVPLFEMPMALKGCQYLIDTREVDLRYRDHSGRTLFHYSAANGWSDILDSLLLEHPYMGNETDTNGQTPLVYTASHSCERIECTELLFRGANFLIQNGVDVKIVDNNGQSILHHLVTRGMVDLMKAVIQQIKSQNDRTSILNWTDHKGQTAAMHAISKEYNGNRELETAIQGCKYLVQIGTNMDAVDKNGRTILHYLAKKGVIELIELVLSKNKELLNRPDHKGRTPIVFASCELCRIAELESSAQGCKYLLMRNADIKIKDNAGKTFRYWCKSNSKWNKEWQRLLKQCPK